jgi:phage baseplate assembly protein W|tara:strand:- start:17533 stop:17904 length:372 start_codon:yes stop_codon:yes gene_type:complete
MANIYKGFSTVGKVRAPYTLIDGELIKQDLMNELKARKGERVMRPNFGTTLYDILMNPLDQYVIEEVKEEVERVISKDPRVQIDEIFTQTLDHLIRVQVQLKFLPTLDEDRLFLEFARTDVEI